MKSYPPGNIKKEKVVKLKPEDTLEAGLALRDPDAILRLVDMIFGFDYEDRWPS